MYELFVSDDYDSDCHKFHDLTLAEALDIAEYWLSEEGYYSADISKQVWLKL